MPSSSTATLLVAGTAIAGAFAVSQLFGTSPSRVGGATDIDDYEEEFIDEELVCKIFDRLFMEMQMVIAQLGQQVQQIQMSGQRIPEAHLKQLLTAEFERSLLAKQAAVYEQHDVDADCVEEATWEFLSKEDEYPKVKKAVERFQKLYESISGESVVGRRPGVTLQAEKATVLTADKTIEAAQVYFSALSAAMQNVVEEFKAEGKDITSPTGQMELQTKFGDVANDAGEKALSGLGIGMKDFQASVEQNASDPKVGRTLHMLQVQQQQELQTMMKP